MRLFVLTIGASRSRENDHALRALWNDPSERQWILVCCKARNDSGEDRSESSCLATVKQFDHKASRGSFKKESRELIHEGLDLRE